jgi:ankyrin
MNFEHGSIRACRKILCATLVLACTTRPCGAETPLIDALRFDTANDIRELLDRGADPNATLADGSTALHWAAQAEKTDAIEHLLAAGASPNAVDRYGVTPLYLAAENGNTDIIRRLLDAGAPADARAPTDETLLMLATRTGRVSAIELLLTRGADVNARDSHYGQTALMFAVRENHPDAVSLLLGHGADVDAQTRIGPTPMFVPPCKGTGCGSEGVGINRGGLPDRGRRAAAKGGMTPLIYAARDGRVEVVERLLAAGADIELAEANGIRPLLMAALNNQQQIAHRLLAAGADPNADDFWGRTPLFAAVEYRNLDMNNREQDSPIDNGIDRAPLLELITALLQAGADVNARTREVPPPRRWLYSLNDVSWVDFTGQTPFLRAALSGDVEGMRLLLEHGADPNMPTFAGTTPLMAAAGVNWVVAQTYTVSPADELAAVRLCLELGNDINASNSMGLTALLGAVNRGANDIVGFLAQAGADLTVVDVEGRDAMRWAEGVFLAAVGAERKPATIALIERLQRERQGAAL